MCPASDLLHRHRRRHPRIGCCGGGRSICRRLPVIINAVVRSSPTKFYRVTRRRVALSQSAARWPAVEFRRGARARPFAFRHRLSHPGAPFPSLSPLLIPPALVESLCRGLFNNRRVQKRCPLFLVLLHSHCAMVVCTQGQMGSADPLPPLENGYQGRQV